jgi:hypothetical protein
MLPFEDATEGVVQAAGMMFLNVNDSNVQVNFMVDCNVVLLLFSAWSVALASLGCHSLPVAETPFTGQRQA